MEGNSTRITISPIFQGHCTERDLIEPKTTVSLFVNPKDLANLEGFFFQVRHPNYFLEAGVRNNELYLIRNKNTISTSFQRTNQTNDTMFEIQWSPEKLSVVVLDDSFRTILENGGDGEKEIDRRKQTLETPTIYPPSSLVKWARAQDIIPKIQYESEEDFLQAVTTSIQSIYDSIKSNNTYSAFWDTQYEGKKILKKIPKKEPEIQSIIRLLITQQANLKNWEIAPEYPTGSGNLDFLITGVLSSYKQVGVCIEFKLAHNTKLEHGLKEQLPDYMRNKGTKNGIFITLWFKGKNFDSPTKYKTLKDLDTDLHIIRDSSSLTNIRLIFLDLTLPDPPSKK